MMNCMTERKRKVNWIKSRCDHSHLDLDIYDDGIKFHAKISGLEFHSIEDVELFLKRKGY